MDHHEPVPTLVVWRIWTYRATVEAKEIATGLAEAAPVARGWPQLVPSEDTYTSQSRA